MKPSSAASDSPNFLLQGPTHAHSAPCPQQDAEENGQNSDENLGVEEGANDQAKNEANNLFEELRLKCMNRSNGSNSSCSRSSFESSSDSDHFERAIEARDILIDQEQIFRPLYRTEHGGILIYDNEAIIPGQPIPSFQCENHRHAVKVSHFSPCPSLRI